MTLSDLLVLLALAALAWYWLDTQRAGELATAAARSACAADGVQFLDDTVAGTRTHFVRDEHGRLRLGRAYRFEFSDTGNDRHVGSVMLLGHEVQIVNTGLRLVH